MYINNDFLNKLIKAAESKNIEYDVYEGSLLDNYIFYANKELGFSRRTKYIIVKEVFESHNSSVHELIFTDSDRKVEKFLKEIK